MKDNEAPVNALVYASEKLNKFLGKIDERKYRMKRARMVKVLKAIYSEQCKAGYLHWSDMLVIAENEKYGER